MIDGISIGANIIPSFLIKDEDICVAIVIIGDEISSQIVIEIPVGAYHIFVIGDVAIFVIMDVLIEIL